MVSTTTAALAVNSAGPADQADLLAQATSSIDQGTERKSLAVDRPSLSVHEQAVLDSTIGLITRYDLAPASVTRQFAELLTHLLSRPRHSKNGAFRDSDPSLYDALLSSAATIPNLMPIAKDAVSAALAQSIGRGSPHDTYDRLVRVRGYFGTPQELGPVALPLIKLMVAKAPQLEREDIEFIFKVAGIVADKKNVIWPMVPEAEERLEGPKIFGNACSVLDSEAQAVAARLLALHKVSPPAPKVTPAAYADLSGAQIANLTSEQLQRIAASGRAGVAEMLTPVVYGNRGQFHESLELALLVVGVTGARLDRSHLTSPANPFLQIKFLDSAEAA